MVLESHVQLVEQAAREYERDPEPAGPGGVRGGGAPAGEYEPGDDFDLFERADAS